MARRVVQAVIGEERVESELGFDAVRWVKQ
jgi:hypothetical protein